MSWTTKKIYDNIGNHLIVVEGTYAYIEASPPQSNGDKARLVSQVIKKTNSPFCFQFWYNMKGTNIGQLTVYTLINGVRSPIWQLSGQQNTQTKWLLGRVSFTQTKSNFQVNYYVCVCYELLVKKSFQDKL